MRGAIRSFLASSLAMLAASSLPANGYDRLQDYEFKSNHSYRSRFPGKARPAGSKLARKAAKGRVGISSIR